MKILDNKIRSRFNMLFIWPQKLYTYSSIGQGFDTATQYNIHCANIARSLTRLSSRPITVDKFLSPAAYSKQCNNSNERVPLPFKTCYTVCLWQPYFWLTDTYSALIQGNDQLNLLNDANLHTAAAQADILFFSSGGNFSVNDILEQIDLSDKYVIIISTYSEQEIRTNIKHRIDHYQNAYLVDSQAEFDQFIANVLVKATKQD
ncbi:MULTISPECIES: hypothetical protein [Sphingobacterium]|uniref:hypothetical protein n=1 Tax=Sphingobacterium TaxID=28453 RepID=UPI00211B8DDE|nr:hypothetical protein [Sphingobacterium sp. E70]ULT26270.1 hypothetical protein KUH03_04965 [Sphingobacterium sp. E70]